MPYYIILNHLLGEVIWASYGQWWAKFFHIMTSSCLQIEGILPKEPYLPCISMAGRALLAGYHRDDCLNSAHNLMWIHRARTPNYISTLMLHSCWAHNWNTVKLHFALISVSLIQADHNFTQLSQQLCSCGMCKIGHWIDNYFPQIWT